MTDWLEVAKTIMPGLYDLEAGPSVRMPSVAETAFEFRGEESPPAWYDPEKDVVNLIPGLMRLDVDRESAMKGFLEHELRHALWKRWKETLPETVFKEAMGTIPVDRYINRLLIGGEGRRMSLSSLLQERFAAEPYGSRWRPAPIESREYIQGLLPMLLYGAYEPRAFGE